MVDGLALGGLVPADGAGVPQLGEPPAVRVQVRDQVPEPLVGRVPGGGRARSATMAAWSARRDPGVCRTRVGGPGKLRHAPLRWWPRHPDGSPISAA